DSSDGFDLTVDTTDLELGEEVFYARAFDRGYFATDRIVTVDLVGPQTLPEKPTALEAIGTGTHTILLNFNDTSEDESGFLLEVSRSPDFDITADIERVYLPPSEGTGPV